MPSRIVDATSARRGVQPSFGQAVEVCQRFVQQVAGADDAHLLLHHLAEALDHLRGILSTLPFQRRQRIRYDAVDVVQVHLGELDHAGGVSRGELAGALAEGEQVRERVPAEAIGTVHPGGRLASGVQSRDAGFLRFGVHLDSAHDVVGGRSDLHRLLGDVDGCEFHELVVHPRELLPDVVGVLPRDVEEDAAVRGTPSGLPLGVDRLGDHIARQQLGRAAHGRLPSGHDLLDPLHRFILGVGELRGIHLRDVVEHEPLTLAVAQDSSLTAHTLRDEDALDRRWPDHSSGVELEELHVPHLRSDPVGERVPLSRVFPGTGADRPAAGDAARGEHDRLGVEHVQRAVCTIVGEAAGDAPIAGEQTPDCVLHEHLHSRVDAPLLQGTDQLQAGGVADVRQTRIGVSTEVSLVRQPVGSAIEDRPPLLEFADALR